MDSLDENFYYYIPLVAHLPSETKEEFSSRWNKIDGLQEITKDKLSDKKTIESIKQIEKLYNLNIQQIINIAIVIRSYYFGELKLEDFPKIFSEEMGIDLNKAQEISNLVIQKIINDDSQEKEYQSQLVKLTLPDALKKYPELGEQLITSNKIKLSNFSEPVRPSIKNWLSNYTFNLGYGAHNTMQRGEFVFQNENTRALSHQDRQKLTYILKAFDENMLITINVNLKQIIFPKTEAVAEHKIQQDEIKKISDINLTTNSKPTNKSEWQKQEYNGEPKDIFQIRNETNDFFKKAPANQQDYTLNSQKNIINNRYNQPERKYEPPKFEPPLKKSLEDEKENNLKFSSPQKMPFESSKPKIEKEENYGPKPLVITPGAFERGNGNSYSNQSLPKNVVNLKE